MRIRCFEKPKLLGAIAWLGERQHLWPDWRRIAEATDGATLAAHLVDIGRDAAFEQFGSTDYLYESFEGARVVVLEDGVTAEVIAKLATRDLPIIRHTFPSTGHLIMFLLWLDEGGRDATSVDLALRALLEGRDALARLLAGIAAGLPKGRRRRAGDRRQARRRLRPPITQPAQRSRRGTYDL